MPRVEHRSQKNDWMTPDCVLDLVRAFDVIGFDPCATADNPVDAREFVAPPADGLSCDWQRRGLVYVNPPYSDMKKWAARIYQEALIGAEIIALTPARPDTQWWRVMLSARPLILFWEGRLTFKGADNAAPFPSCLHYFGDRNERFKRVFDDCGWFCKGER